MTEQAIVTPDEPQLTRHPVLFFGKAGEFFSIWIVNVALTIVTLGIYSAWAKVRTNRYFYGNTEVAGNRFDYTADPVKILQGRIIAFVLFVVLSNLNLFNPILGVVGSIAILVLLPFAMVLSLRFRMAKSMYRNVSFRFVGGYGEAALVLYVAPMIGFLSLGLLLPLASKMTSEFLYKNIRYGDRVISLNLPTKRLYGFFLRAAAMMVPALILWGVFIATLTNTEGPAPFTWLHGLLALIVYILIAGSISYYTTNVLNMCFNYGVLDGKHRFQSVMNPWKVLEIRVTNAIAIILSLGMLYPWAQIRFMSYRSSCTAVLAAGDVDAFTDDVDASVTATGEGFGDFIDLDIGL